MAAKLPAFVFVSLLATQALGQFSFSSLTQQDVLSLLNACGINKLSLLAVRQEVQRRHFGPGNFAP